MKREREIIRKKAAELTNAAEFFEKHAGFHPDDAPAKYGGGVQAAWKAINDQLEVAILFDCEEIKEICENEVVLVSGISFTGEMPPRILKDSDSVFSYVITLCGFEELKNTMTDIMALYFMDAWGTAFAEAGQAWLGKYVKSLLEEEGLTRTHLWSPGQHEFSLANQRSLFSILKPEEVGCTLTKTLMMVPVKSVSGIMGGTSPEVKDHLLPCDFCKLGATCPASKRGCAEL